MSLLRVNQLQIGQSSNANNNVALLPDATTPGQAKLVRGDAGAEIADLLVFKPDGRVELGKASEQVESGRVLVDADYIARYLQKILFESTGMVLFETAGTTTWQVPEVLRLGLKKPEVLVIGGGGSGGVYKDGDISTTPFQTQGGSGGGWVICMPDLKGVEAVQITVGAGGAGKVGDGRGNQGGTSMFGGYATAYGGDGGHNEAVFSSLGLGVGGNSSSNVPGALKGQGLQGAVSINTGTGGGSYLGGSSGGSWAGNAVSVAGAGSSGARERSYAGANGLVMVKW